EVPTDRNDYLNHLLEHVADAGVTTNHIIGDHTQPSYSHTVGLSAVGHPELLITGCAVEDASDILLSIGHAVAVHGHRLLPGWAVGSLVVSMPSVVASTASPRRSSATRTPSERGHQRAGRLTRRCGDATSQPDVQRTGLMSRSRRERPRAATVGAAAVG